MDQKGLIVLVAITVLVDIARGIENILRNTENQLLTIRIRNENHIEV
jgi:hypothetical protein